MGSNSAAFLQGQAGAVSQSHTRKINSSIEAIMPVVCAVAQALASCKQWGLHGGAEQEGATGLVFCCSLTGSWRRRSVTLLLTSRHSTRVGCSHRQSAPQQAARALCSAKHAQGPRHNNAAAAAAAGPNPVMPSAKPDTTPTCLCVGYAPTGVHCSGWAGRQQVCVCMPQLSVLLPSPPCQPSS